MESKNEELFDTDGQMFQPVDFGTSRHLANSRSAEIEREVRNERNRKDVERSTGSRRKGDK